MIPGGKHRRAGLEDEGGWCACIKSRCALLRCRLYAYCHCNCHPSSQSFPAEAVFTWFTLFRCCSSALNGLRRLRQNQNAPISELRDMSSIPRATSTTPLLAPSRGPSPQPPSRSHSLLPIRQRQRQRRRTPPIHILPALLTLTLFALVAFIAWDVSSFGNCYFAPLCRTLGDGKERIDEVWWRNAGAYAPWRSLGTGGGRGGLPRGCEIDQVTVVRPFS